MGILGAVDMPYGIFFQNETADSITCTVRLVDLSVFTLTLLPRIRAAIGLINGESIANDAIDILNLSVNIPIAMGSGTILEPAANTLNPNTPETAYVVVGDYYLDRVLWMPCLLSGHIQYDIRSISQAIALGVSIVYVKVRSAAPPEDTNYLRYAQRLGGLFGVDSPSSLYLGPEGAKEGISDIIIASIWEGYGNEIANTSYGLTPLGLSLHSAAIAAYGSANAPNDILVRGLPPDEISYNSAGMPVFWWRPLLHEPNLTCYPLFLGDQIKGYTQHSTYVGATSVYTVSLSGVGMRYADGGSQQPVIYPLEHKGGKAVAVESLGAGILSASQIAAMMRLKWR